jgi:uncharacterized iron-regulated membrane protein
MKTFRQIIFWCHLLIALGAGIVIALMSVTGVLLTYEKQMIAWADARAVSAAAPSPSGERLGVESLLSSAMLAEKATPTTITLRAEPAAAQVAFGRERTLFVDTVSGDVLGEGATGVRHFFSRTRDWHRWLGVQGENRATAKAITGASNIGFLFLVVSGLYLWWPRNWKKGAVKNVTLFRSGLKGKARDFNWHNVIGFWSCIPLFIVVLSGVVISYPWASNLVYQLAGETPPVRRAPSGGGARGGERGPRAAVPLDGLNALWTRAERQSPGWTSISMKIPSAKDADVSFTIDTGTGGEPQKKGTLTLDRRTGETTEWEPFASGSTGKRMRAILRFAHTGEVLGLTGQTLAGLVSLGGAVLVWTGFALAWRRFLAWRGRRQRNGAGIASEDRPVSTVGS